MSDMSKDYLDSVSMKAVCSESDTEEPQSVPRKLFYRCRYRRVHDYETEVCECSIPAHERRRQYPLPPKIRCKVNHKRKHYYICHQCKFRDRICHPEECKCDPEVKNIYNYLPGTRTRDFFSTEFECPHCRRYSTPTSTTAEQIFPMKIRCGDCRKWSYHRASAIYIWQATQYTLSPLSDYEKRREENGANWSDEETDSDTCYIDETQFFTVKNLQTLPLSEFLFLINGGCRGSGDI